MGFRWAKWVESELRFYLCRQLHREDIEWSLKEMDKDIRISSSSLSGMPRSSSSERYSSVERQTEYREDARARYQEMLEQFNLRLRNISKALYSLSPLYLETIRLSYFSVQFASDLEIANHLNINEDELQQIKQQAIHSLYDQLCPQRSTA